MIVLTIDNVVQSLLIKQLAVVTLQVWGENTCGACALALSPINSKWSTITQHYTDGVLTEMTIRCYVSVKMHESTAFTLSLITIIFSSQFIS